MPPKEAKAGLDEMLKYIVSGYSLLVNRPLDMFTRPPSPLTPTLHSSG